MQFFYFHFTFLHHHTSACSVTPFSFHESNLKIFFFFSNSRFSCCRKSAADERSERSRKLACGVRRVAHVTECWPIKMLEFQNLDFSLVETLWRQTVTCNAWNSWNRSFTCVNVALAWTCFFPFLLGIKTFHVIFTFSRLNVDILINFYLRYVVHSSLSCVFIM